MEVVCGIDSSDRAGVRAVEEFWSGDWYLDPSGARWIKIGRERVVDADETENNYLAARRVQRFGAEGIWNYFCAVARRACRQRTDDGQLEFGKVTALVTSPPGGLRSGGKEVLSGGRERRCRCCPSVVGWYLKNQGTD
ncbi:hypothetical protein B0H16DRAFT_1448392 [Mycena metata]|uniref:Uncharacterized protein n=1 Tax=Mycena metata TaxID=1033252 RepID=A0AAD7K7I1_9AGAR|nr:hypothetical protein B0H16DRAFT_1448392 [Mycena metata]